MTNLKTKITVMATSAILLLNSFSGVALANTSLEISGNGSFSDNVADISTQNNTTVVQENRATIHNNVDSNVSTGGNRANDNTNGDVVIDTGNAKAHVDLSTKVNLNSAEINGCDNCDSNSDILISGNGSRSDNNVSLDSSSDTSIFQENDAYVSNYVDTHAKTGYNDANRNTGGDVVVSTGNALTSVDIETKANANIASINGLNHDRSNETDLKIHGNGARSDSEIDLVSERSKLIVQENSARIRNVIDSHATTGGNEANDNTNGDVIVGTGFAASITDISNMVNFNAADLDCGCLTQETLKISGNGFDSDNDIRIHLDEALSAFQNNDSDITNDVDSFVKTGENDANRNTGDEHSDDPAIFTGNSISENDIESSGNVNLFGPSVRDLFSGVDLGFHFDLGGIMNTLANLG